MGCSAAAAMAQILAGRPRRESASFIRKELVYRLRLLLKTSVSDAKAKRANCVMGLRKAPPAVVSYKVKLRVSLDKRIKYYSRSIFLLTMQLGDSS